MAALLHQVSLVENSDHQVMKEHWHYTSAIMPGQQLYCFPQVSGHSAVHWNGNGHSEYTTSLRTGVKDKGAEVTLTSTVLDLLLWKCFLFSSHFVFQPLQTEVVQRCSRERGIQNLPVLLHFKEEIIVISVKGGLNENHH